MAPSYTYALKTGSLKEFLGKVKSKELGVPDKVNRDYLKSIGYTSSNDFPIIRVLKSINFIDKSSAPTQNFKDFRTEKSRQVMAAALRNTYAELFKIYAKPYQKSRETLENFFAKGKPSLKKYTLGLYVDTFKILCEFADLEAAPPKIEAKEAKEEVIEKRQVISEIPEGLTINLNIQLTLPVTDDAKVYENIFKALKEHLFTRD